MLAYFMQVPRSTSMQVFLFLIQVDLLKTICNLIVFIVPFYLRFRDLVYGSSL